MSMERASAHLAKYGLAEKIREFTESSATVALAAERLGCEPARIAKTLSFLVEDHAILVVAAGDVKVDNPKYKARFHTKARMLSPAQAVELVGHAVGGVCPFGINAGLPVYMDESLRKYEIVYPAAGDDHSAVKLTVKELKLR